MAVSSTSSGTLSEVPTCSLRFLIAGWLGFISIVFLAYKNWAVILSWLAKAWAFWILSIEAEYPCSVPITIHGDSTNLWLTTIFSTFGPKSFFHHSIKGLKSFSIFFSFFFCNSSSSSHNLNSPLATFFNFFFSYSPKFCKQNSSIGSSKIMTSPPFSKIFWIKGDLATAALSSPAKKYICSCFGFILLIYSSKLVNSSILWVE